MTDTSASVRPVAERGSTAIEVGPELGEDGKPNAAGWRWIGREFRKPMPTFSARKPGGERSYITARQVAERLDAVIGPGNWATDWSVVRAEHPVVVRYGLSVFGVWRWDAGYSNNPDAVDEYIEAVDRQSGQRIVDETTGEVRVRRNPAYEDEPLKAACSDGLKRAAVQWGIGRWLYPEMRPRQ